MSGWKTLSLGEVIQLQYGKPLDPADRRPKGLYPVYGANGEKDRTDKFFSDRPSIIVGRKGSAGEITLTEDRFWPLDVTYFVEFERERYDLQFLYHLLKTLDLPGLAKGVKPGINRNEVYALPVAVPPLSEQRRIVAILDEAFEAIATAKANAEKNLRNAGELFAGRLETVFTRRERQCSHVVLSDVCDILSKLVDPRDDKFVDLPHVGAGNIESKTGALVGVMTAHEEQLISGKFLFDETTVLYSKIRPYLMKVVRPDFRGLCSADIYPLAPKAGRIDRDYLYYLLLSPPFTEFAIKGSARAGMPKVNREHLFAFQVALPSFDQQKRAAANLDELAEETRRLESIYDAKVAALDELKQSLLHQAFSGALTSGKLAA